MFVKNSFKKFPTYKYAVLATETIIEVFPYIISYENYCDPTVIPGTRI